MYQVDLPTAAATLPTPAAAGTPGFFTNGNPATGVAATIVDADFLNMLMMELSNIVTGAGIALSKTTYNQVLTAIKRIGQNTTVLADTGAANAYTATNSPQLVAGTWVDGVVQAVKITHANTGASTYAPDGLPAIPIYGLGLQALQGGELVVGGTAILMRTTIAGVNSGNPICVLMECAGGAQQVPAATQSQHAMQLGQATGRLLRTTVYTLNSGVQQVSVNGGAFTSTGAGTFTAQSATKSAIIEVVGGGGGSGATATTSNASVTGGGGGGAYGKGLYTSGFGSLAITVGAGGSAGSTGGNGGNGGTTSAGALISAQGGSGSTGNATYATNAGAVIFGGAGAPSSVGGNVITSQGGRGGAAFISSQGNTMGGDGGTSGNGYPGGYGVGSGQTANPGVGPGSGSGGVSIINGATVSGGVGAAGIVIIQEFA